ncbi:MAG TPA: hypothetical protein DDY37_06525, partial [Legionella sp.]|nr:hypothetical protein [Legionella sp.]
APKDAQELTMHLLQFKVQGQSSILQNAEKEIELARDITDRMIDIRLHPQQGNPLIAQNMALLKEINTHRLPGTDPLLDEFMDTNINEICNNTTNDAALYTTNSRLVTMLASLDSPEIIDVNQTVLRLASTSSTRDKANNIAAAFRALPLAERRRVISMPEANPVQQALARHRFFPHTGAVYFKDDKIDTDRAATAFKTLKTKYLQDLDSVHPRHAAP